MTGEIEPQLNAQNQVIGFLARRVERQREPQHVHSARSLLHAVIDS